MSLLIWQDKHSELMSACKFAMVLKVLLGFGNYPFTYIETNDTLLSIQSKTLLYRNA